MTYLCVPILVRDITDARRDIAAAAEAGADMVELRIDHLTRPVQVVDIVSSSVLPCIITCRPTSEGGHCELANAERLDLLLSATHVGKPLYIDFEWRAIPELGNHYTIPFRYIVSSHDFAGRPERLYNLVADMTASKADVVKIVWTARTIRDNLEAFEILRTRAKPTIALCMGEAGMISRILCKKFGGLLTFASLEKGSGTAAGQIPIADMKRIYCWDALGPATKVYGVVGDPIGHSMSPAIHNASFDAIGFDGIYLPLLVEGSYESFKAFMESFIAAPGLDFSGVSVTIPHKENALRYLLSKGAQIEDLAARIGTVNTIVIDRAAGVPALRGFNTDYAAILDTITAALGITRNDLRGQPIAVIGAGGTGRTAVAALAHCGAAVTIYNRTPARAEALAREFDGHTGTVTAAPLEALAASQSSIYINATSVGMHPNVDACPWGDKPPRLTASTLIFDTIYNPMETRLLKEARAAGAQTAGGVEMFVRQAVGQFESWTGRAAPVEVMRQVVEERLRQK